VTLILVREAAPVPELPAGAVLIGKAYDFTPSGATFDGQVALTLGYDVNSLPEGITSIWIATYHTSPGWEALTAQQNRVAGADSVTASFSRFSIFAVLAAVRGASFSAANLNISPSQRTLWPAFPLIRLSGREVNISADASNNGGQQGTYALSLIVDSQVKGQKSISLSPSQTQKVTFSLRGVGFGRHAVQLGGVTGQFVTSFSINWWLLVAIILVLALLGWLISRYVRGRTKRREKGQPA